MAEKQLDLEEARKIVTERAGHVAVPKRPPKDEYPAKETVKQAIRELHDEPKEQTLLRQLATPFPPDMVRAAPQGKYGEYVPHTDVTQRALSIVGFYNFEVLEVIRGHASEIVSKAHTWPARDNAIVGVLCRLTIFPDGQPRSITEGGAEDNPAMHNDGENLKNCISDAYKRCWMRFGLALHVWAGKDYWLDRQLDRHDPTVR